MNLSEKTKAYLIGALSLIVILSLLLWIGEIILPFIIAIFIAYLLNPLILKIQTKIKNRDLAITSILLVMSLLLIGIIVFLGGHIVNDTKRFITAVEVFGDENKEQITDTKNKVLGFVDDVYKSDVVQKQFEVSDTLASDSNKMDLMSTLESIYSFFEDPNPKTDEPTKESWNWFFFLIYTGLYSVLILYNYDYFEEKQKKYFGDIKPNSAKSYGIWLDFEVVFLNYFKQRAKVVMISIFIFILAFSLINLPGAILIGLIAGILTYAAHFHYLSLPLVAIGCWVLSVEHDTSFFVFFGIVLAVYILISVLEETVFFNKIMKSVSGMNPVIILLAFTLWIYVFGGFVGTIIALPLTQLIMIYMDRILMYSKNKRESLVVD
jgi:predicted PurR-regulated permease PerM